MQHQDYSTWTVESCSVLGAGHYITSTISKPDKICRELTSTYCWFYSEDVSSVSTELRKIGNRLS